MTGIGFWMKSVAFLTGKFDSLRRSQPIQVRRVFYDESQPYWAPLSLWGTLGAVVRAVKEYV